MKTFISLAIFLLASTASSDGQNESSLKTIKSWEYRVERLESPMEIDGNWEKIQWEEIKSVFITNYMGEIPRFRPKTEVKLMYDDNNVYVIFRVKDRYVKSVVTEYNGNVSGDSCVEFFFSPDPHVPEEYFNLEINAGGTPLLFYVTEPWTGFNKLHAEEISQIEIAHSLPKIIDPEITDSVIWTLEYRVPLSVLERYSNVARPSPGVKWRANFYKTASLNSNPHWITWSYVDSHKPNFHLPKYFGTLKF